ncbi:MAG: hypothetical protein QM775_21570 [Pirellulales bacterium]
MKNPRGPRRRKSTTAAEPTHVIRSDGAHRESAGARNQADERIDALRESPSEILQLGDPRLMERLEELDDVVFEAIAGKQSAISRLRSLWPEIVGPLSPALADESREAYCRHALQKWLDCTENGASAILSWPLR